MNCPARGMDEHELHAADREVRRIETKIEKQAATIARLTDEVERTNASKNQMEVELDTTRGMYHAALDRIGTLTTDRAVWRDRCKELTAELERVTQEIKAQECTADELATTLREVATERDRLRAVVERYRHLPWTIIGGSLRAMDHRGIAIDVEKLYRNETAEASKEGSC